MQQVYDVHDVERRWQSEWELAGCHHAPQRPHGEKFFVHDATPFPNGPIHLGHVRTYVLGDVTARYQRLLGKSVLYYTGFDSFGLAIELEAMEQKVSPRSLVDRTIALQKSQFERLGISFDRRRLADSSDPRTYRWTQQLFLMLYDAGWIVRRDAPVPWCAKCATTLARMQVDAGACWRCRGPVEDRTLAHWTVQTSRFAPQLRANLLQLTGWSDHAKRAMAAILDDHAAEGGARGQGGGDWSVSRQRSWGTPIPLVHCESCGVVPVPASQLPVLLPTELDWEFGSGALARDRTFVETACPRCAGAAQRETDTLDCSFDDQWCYFQTLVLDAESPGFTRENLAPWLPVDRSQSGIDTYAWFHLYRCLGLFLYEQNLLDDPNFIRGFFGHEMVLADGRKMSKHLGNAVSPDAILKSYGADTLRVAMMWSAGPHRSFYWKQERLDRAQKFLGEVYRLAQRVAEFERDSPAQSVASSESSESSESAETLPKKSIALRRELVRVVGQVARFIEDVRPNAAIEALVRFHSKLQAYATARMDGGRLNASSRVHLAAMLADFAVALAPFAPHLAEEVWRLRGNNRLVAQSGWPRGA